MKSILIIIVLIVITGGWYLISRHSQSYPPTTIVPTIAQPSVYPSPASNLPTAYISAVDWPPKVSIENKAFSCTESAQTKRLQINNHNYCVTKSSEGAAGSVYVQYIYAKAKDDRTETFTFSLRFVQCENYPEAEKAICIKERQTFGVENFIDEYILNIR